MGKTQTLGVMLTAITIIYSSNLAKAADGTGVFTVSGVPSGDTLNIRRKPKASSAVVGQLRNGEQGFFDTNNCWNSATGKKVKASQLSSAKPNQWCAVMTGEDPVITGFARYKYLGQE